MHHILQDQNYGVVAIQKMLAAGYVSQEERCKLAERTRASLATMKHFDQTNPSYKRLIEELDSIDAGPVIYSRPGGASPARSLPSTATTPDEVQHVGYYSPSAVAALPTGSNNSTINAHLPSPASSPVHGVIPPFTKVLMQPKKILSKQYPAQ